MLILPISPIYRTTDSLQQYKQQQYPQQKQETIKVSFNEILGRNIDIKI
jgi:hypothetical protein